MHIAFRVDASEKIGTGHFTRCLTLANALRKAGATTRFVCRHVMPAQAESAAAEGHKLVKLGAANLGGVADTSRNYGDWLETDQETDANATVAALSDEPRWDWLVVDHYALDERWETRLRGAAGKLLVIDDLADRCHECDVLLDQNLQISNDRYDDLLAARCRQLIGPRYALLRPEFREARINSPELADRINIFFGGVDPGGLTLRALRAVEMLKTKRPALDIVVGRNNPHLRAIEDYCSRLGNADLHVQTRDMARLFARADLAIGAGGTTSWERCCLGVPSIIVSAAENQNNGGLALARAGAAIYLGDSTSFDDRSLSDAVARTLEDRALLQTMRNSGREIVDGRGADRVLLYMLRGTVALRLAGPADMDRAWLWRNDPQTRKYVNDPSPIDLATHRIWWQNSLSSPTRDLLIAHCGGISVGTLRFDYQRSSATISIYIDAELNGLGLGSAILRAGTAWVKMHKPNISELRADVLPTNKRSNRSFAAAGFVSTETGIWTRRMSSDSAAASVEKRRSNENR